LSPLQKDLERIWPEGIAGELSLLREEATFDPSENLERESRYMREADSPSLRVWRNSDCVVLGRFLKAGDEVHLDRAARLGVPVLKRPSGGGAVFHDMGNINYSLYLREEALPGFDLEVSLRVLSFPVVRVLEEMGVPWEWVPPNSIYVRGKKVSGSAQARSGGRILHHGTLLVETDLDRLRHLLKEGGRSRTAPVVNLGDITPGIKAEDVVAAFKASIPVGDGGIERPYSFEG
jgi:lipoate-protein ligase A